MNLNSETSDLGWRASAAPSSSALAPPEELPSIDITQNPGCGETGLSRVEKIERNRRLAHIYVQSSHQWPKHRKMYNWNFHECWAEGARVRFGTLDPLGSTNAIAIFNPPEGGDTQGVRPSAGTDAPAGADANSEARGYRRLYPDFGAQPESFTVHPFEDGFYYNVSFTGHHKDTGEAQSLWETGLVLVNEEGRITFWDFWDDPIGLASFAKALYGIEPDELTLETYIMAVSREAENAP
jgi:hypothetical protein